MAPATSSTKPWTVVAALCGVGLFLPLLLPLVTGRILTLDDLGAFHLPVRFLYQQALRSHDSVLWTPSLYSGYYLFGEGQAGMAHPLHWLLYRYLPLGAALNLEIASAFALMFLGARFFLPRLGISPAGAWFGATTFAFGGPTLLHLIHANAIAVVAHAPWLLAATHTLLTTTIVGQDSSSDEWAARRRRRAWAWLAIVMLLASQLLLGHPQYVWLTWLAVAYYACCLLRGAAHSAGQLGLVSTSMLLLIVAAVLGLGAGAIQWIPTLDVLQSSAHDVLTDEMRFGYSWHPVRDLLTWLAPRAVRIDYPHEFALYNGSIGLTALAWLAIRRRALTNRALLPLFAFAAVNIVLALGSYGLVYPWLARLPLVSSFRAPVRHLLLTHMALSALAAMAFDDLARVIRDGPAIAWSHLRPLAIVPWLSAIIVVNGALQASGDTPVQWASYSREPVANLMHAWPWLCVLIATTALVALAARRRTWTLSAILVLSALDQGAWGYSYLYGVRAEHLQTIHAFSERIPTPPGAAHGDTIYLENLTTGGYGNVNVLLGLRRSNGYVGLTPLLVLDPTDERSQRIAGVAWTRVGAEWRRVIDPMPRARMIATAFKSDNVARDLKTIDISRAVLVSEDIGTLTGKPGEARVVRDRPGEIDIEVTTTGRQLLIVTERYAAGWHVTVDAAPFHVVRAYDQYLGVIVGPGIHAVTLRFQPTSLRTGLYVSAWAIALCLVGTFVLWRR